MTNMAHVVTARSNRREKFNRSHHRHKNSHRNRHGQRKHPHLPVRHQYRTGQENSINRTRSPNGRRPSAPLSVRINNQFHDYVYDSRTNSSQKIVDLKFSCTPHPLQIGAKHRQIQKVEQNVQHARVQKEIGKRLPDPESKHSCIGDQSKPRLPESRSALAKKQRRKLLQHKHRNACNADRFDGRWKILSQVKPMTISAAENRVHSSSSLKRQPTRVKAAKWFSTYPPKRPYSGKRSAISKGGRLMLGS